jgi:hypothetical protein
MSDTSARLRPPKAVSIQKKPSGLSASDLAERLALIQGHATKFPVSGAKIQGNFLLVALAIPGHVLEVTTNGAWLLDGKDVTLWGG